MQSWTEVIAATPVAAALRGSGVLYPIVNAAHILSIALVVGAIATLDLRILGFFSRAPLRILAPPLSRMAGTGVVLAALTGVMLFSVRPLAYIENPAFLMKVTLAAAAVLNASALRASTDWSHACAYGTVAGGVKASALFSLLAWTGAILAGRWIGFLQ